MEQYRIVVTAVHNKKNYDRTKLYSLNDDRYIINTDSPNDQLDGAKRPNGETCGLQIKNCQQSIGMSERAKRPNGLSQTDPPIPDINTDTKKIKKVADSSFENHSKKTAWANSGIQFD